MMRHFNLTSAVKIGSKTNSMPCGNPRLSFQKTLLRLGHCRLKTLEISNRMGSTWNLLNFKCFPATKVEKVVPAANQYSFFAPCKRSLSESADKQVEAAVSFSDTLPCCESNPRHCRLHEEPPTSLIPANSVRFCSQHKAVQLLFSTKDDSRIGNCVTIKEGQSQKSAGIFLGYLESSPFHVYCTIGERNQTSPNVIYAPLSDFEHRTLCAGSSRNAETTPDTGGRPSPEQLKIVFNQLSYELPGFFTKPPDYQIYHKNVVFKNNIRGTTTVGLPLYVQQMAITRVLAHLRYSHVKMTILKITEHPEDGTIRVRWRIVGTSGIRSLLMFWKFRLWEWKKMMSNESEWIDGFSIFHVDSNGMIHLHECDKMMPDDNTKTVESNMAVKLALLLGVFVKPMFMDDLLEITSSDFRSTPNHLI